MAVVNFCVLESGIPLGAISYAQCLEEDYSELKHEKRGHPHFDAHPFGI